MRVVDIVQRSPGWHDWRKAGLSASDAPVVLGVSPFKTRWRLWAEKCGFAPEENLSGNPHIRRGLEEEDRARRAYEERHGVLLLPLCAESDAQPVVRASFDGLTDEGEPVELKCPSWKSFEDLLEHGEESSVFKHYIPQVQQQIYVADAPQGSVSFYCEGHSLDFVIPRDEALITALIEETLVFWRLVETRKEPELDPARDVLVPSGSEAAAWKQLAAQYQEAAWKKAALEAELTRCKEAIVGVENALVSRMGTYLRAEASYIKVTRFTQRGAIDYRKAMEALMPGLKEDVLEAYRRSSTQRVKITDY